MASTTYAELDWYEAPLYYDIIFDDGTDEEASFLLEAQRCFGLTRGRRCLEPACGSGRLVQEMASRGYKVTGFDQSEAMLEFARRRLEKSGHDARLVQAAMESFEFREKFDLAHCLVSTFKYLLDEKSARAHLRCVRDALKPGGIYVLGFHLSEYDSDAKVRERWVGERDGIHVTCNIQSWPPDRKSRLERTRSRLIVKRGEDVRRFETLWDFRTYDASQVRRLLRSVPDLEHVGTFDFTYRLEEPRRLDDELFDCLLILRRR